MPTVTVQVGAGGDDWHIDTVAFRGTFNFINLGPATSTVYRGGWRFDNVAVPQGAVIQSATFLRLTAATNVASPPKVRLQAVDADDPAAPTTTGQHDGLPLTTAFVDWTPGAFTDGNQYESDSLATVIQEVIDRAGWVSGNALIVTFDQQTFSDPGSATVDSYEGSSANAAELVIAYTDPAQSITLNAIAAATTVHQMGISPPSQTIAMAEFSAVAGSEGPNSGSAFSNDNSIGDVAWNNPGSAAADDGSVASAALSTPSASESNYLFVQGPGFSIPDSATPTGIVVSIERNASVFFGLATDLSIRLIKGGVVVGDNKADTGTGWPNTPAAASYGAVDDLWGTTWSASDVNDTDFGVAIAAQLADSEDAASPSIDHVTITVHYVDVPGPATQVHNLAVSPGDASVAMNHLGPTSTLYQMAVEPQSVNVALNHIAATTALYQMSASPGAVDIVLNHLGPTSSLYQVGVSPGAVGIALNHIAATTALYQMAVSPGAATISLDLLGPTSALYPLTVIGPPQDIALDHLGPTATVYQMGIVEAGTIALAHLGPTSTLYPLGIAPGAASIALNHLAGASSVFSPAVAPGAPSIVLAAPVPSSTLYQPAISPGSASVVFDEFGPVAEVYALTVAEEQFIVLSEPVVATEVFEMFAGIRGAYWQVSGILSRDARYFVADRTPRYLVKDTTPRYRVRRSR